MRKKEKRIKNWPFLIALAFCLLLFLEIFIQHQIRAYEEFGKQTDLAITHYENELRRKHWSITGGN